jgi:iron complex transport system substrate-binding protein
MKILAIAFILIVVYSCASNSTHQGTLQTQIGSTDTIKYAKGFSIITVGGCKLLRVFNPWEGAQGIEYKYVLCHKGQVVPDSLHNLPVVHIPIKRIVCLSTTHIGLLSAIDKLGSLVGIAGSRYVSDSTTLKMIADGKVSDVGFDQALNYEVLVGLKPDIVLAYGVGGETATQYKKLEELGIKVILNAEYLESLPLGKCEWIKFLAAFYDISDEASEKFKTIEKDYLQLSHKCDSLIHKPKIMCGLPFKGAWYVPGGESYLAQMIRDAGGDYLWDDIHQRESIPMNFEKVIERAALADLWINTGTSNSMNDIRNEDPRLQIIRPYKERHIYNNNAQTSLGGGNDFWESGITHPNVILKDLIKIFHPELLPHHSLVYYKKLN